MNVDEREAGFSATDKTTEFRDLQITIIEPSTGWVSLKLRELWDYRELLYFLTWRDVKVRYKQTILGGLWALLQPLLLMVVFTFIGGAAGFSSHGVPRSVFTLAALVPWSFFNNGLTNSSNSLVGNASMITKIYFPRLAVPLAAVLSGLVDFAVSFVVLLAMMVYFGISPTVKTLTVPLFLILAIVASVGVGLWLSALNVQFRDVKYVVPFLDKLLLLMTPIVFSISILDEPWRSLSAINPMVGVVEGFRWGLFGHQRLPLLAIGISSVTAVLLMVGGFFYFRRMERTFADVV
jgi:lipopolysaccharide transport system permease protein